MASKNLSKSTYQYDSKGLKNKINHHDFLETRDGVEEYTAFDLERYVLQHFLSN